MNRYLRHPFWQAVLLLGVSYVLIRWGVPYLPGLVGLTSAPVPQSVVFQYTLTILVGILVWVSDNEARWTEFKEPIQDVLIQPERKVTRAVFMILVPLLVAFVTFNNVRPTIAAPASLRSIHPAPPTQITFRARQWCWRGWKTP